MTQVSTAPTAANFVQTLGYPLQLVALNLATGSVNVSHGSDTASLADAIRLMQKLNAERFNVYYEVNPGAAGRRSRSADISHLRAVVGDADSTEGRSIEACFAVAAELPLPPTFTLATGGGVQVVYLLDELVAATPEVTSIHEAVGRGIRDLIDGDAVFDLPRIMRMPGFTNWPNVNKSAAGREPVRAKVLAASGRRYTLVELAQAFVRSATTRPIATAARRNTDLSGGLTAAPWFHDLSPERQNACLAEMLRMPNVVALADTSDGAAGTNWRTVIAACARSGAPDAYALCRAWAQTSPRFDPRDFDSRFRSFCHD